IRATTFLLRHSVERSNIGIPPSALKFSIPGILTPDEEQEGDVALGHSSWDAASNIFLLVAPKRRKLPKIACGTIAGNNWGGYFTEDKDLGLTGRSRQEPTTIVRFKNTNGKRLPAELLGEPAPVVEHLHPPDRVFYRLPQIVGLNFQHESKFTTENQGWTMFNIRNIGHHGLPSRQMNINKTSGRACSGAVLQSSGATDGKTPMPPHPQNAPNSHQKKSELGMETMRWRKSGHAKGKFRKQFCKRRRKKSRDFLTYVFAASVRTGSSSICRCEGPPLDAEQDEWRRVFGVQRRRLYRGYIKSTSQRKTMANHRGRHDIQDGKTPIEPDGIKNWDRDSDNKKAS
ncbi:MAG: hypothetical protein Q9172_005613, partial [Xanthocarpia lactea]